jgi:hypothetical protein
LKAELASMAETCAVGSEFHNRAVEGIKQARVDRLANEAAAKDAQKKAMQANVQRLQEEFEAKKAKLDRERQDREKKEAEEMAQTRRALEEAMAQMAQLAAEATRSESV